MKKKILLGLMLCWTIAAQGQAPIQQVDITADQLLGGSADQELQALGKRAVGESLGIVVTAPAYWRELVEEQIKSGAGSDTIPIQFRETMVESVIVRLVADNNARVANKKSAAVVSGPLGPAPEVPEIETSDLDNAGESLKAQARESISNQSVPEMSASAPKFESTLTPMQAPRMSMGETAFERPETASEEPVAETPAAEVKSPEPVEDPVVESAQAESQDAASVEQTESVRAGLERRLNDGREISKNLKVSQLRRGDQLFRTADLIVAVRRTGAGRNVFWLNGELELDQQAIRRIQSGKYEVMRRVEGQDPVEPVAVDETGPVETAVAVSNLDEAMDERSELEALYNQGNPVESELSVAGLRQGDVLYVGDTLKMVVRRDRVSLKRYWLEGELDLSRSEVEKVGNNKYRVKRIIR